MSKKNNKLLDAMDMDDIELNLWNRIKSYTLCALKKLTI